MGHLPGFKQAKERANESASLALQGQGLTTRREEGFTELGLPQGLEAPASGALIFEGPSESDTNVIPPDPQIAAGPNYVVVVVNSLMGIYSKSGTLVGGFQSLNAFFGSLGLTGEIYDPRVIYDPTNNRFILSAGDVNFATFSSAHVVLAVSQTSDPTGTWNKYALNFLGRNLSNTQNTIPDFPTLGLSSSAVYISTVQFVLDANCLQSDTCSFSDTWIEVVGLPELLSGSSTLNVTTFKNVRTATGLSAFTIQPAVTYGSAPSEFLVAAEYSSNPGTRLNVFTITTSGTPTLSTANLSVPSFSIPPDAVQPGTGVRVATNDFRLLHSVWINNSLWCTQNTGDSSSSAALARWYQINATSLLSISLAQSGDVAGPGNAYYPALGMLANGDVGMAFTTSSVGQFPSSAYTGRASGDPSGIMRQPAIVRAGSAYYSDYDIRWGDYSGASPDPNGGSIWTITEYAGSSNPHFGTAIANVVGLPMLGVSPSSIDFGSLTVNVHSLAQTVTVTNVDSVASATLGQAMVTGPNAGDFAISVDGCSNVTLAPSATCTISLTFTPSALTTRQASLLLGTNPPTFASSVDLHGFGVQATSAIAVNPTSLTFPSTVVYTDSAPMPIQVTNVGADPIAPIIHLQSFYFLQTNNCGSTLLPGTSCQISVTYHPVSVNSGDGIAYLDVRYDGFPSGVSIPTVTLYPGKAIASPLVVLCPRILTFPNQTVGTSSTPQAVIINNSGTSDLTVTSAQINGDFTFSSDCGALPVTIPANKACNLNVTFSPTGTGNRSGTLTIADNAPGSPHSVTLNGSGASLTKNRSALDLTGREPAARADGSSGSATSVAGPSIALQDAGMNVHDSASELRRSAKTSSSFGRVPLAFEENHGQTDPQVKFLSRGPGFEVFLTANGAVLELASGRNPERNTRKHKQQDSAAKGNPQTPGGRKGRAKSQNSVVQLQLLSANEHSDVDGLEKLPGVTNYFIGNDPAKWRTGVANYAKVRYQDVYPGIDLVYYGNQHRLEYDFVVAPGADPRKIRLKVLSISRTPHRHSRRRSLRIDADGNLVIPTDAGEVRFHKPVIYQVSGLSPVVSGHVQAATDQGQRPAGASRPQSAIGNRKLLDGRYILTAGNQVQFEIADYDSSRALVIDPVLTYSTYLGGNDADDAYGIAVDSSGSAYVTGSTASANFPISNPLQSAINRTLPYVPDVFLSKFRPDGTSLVYSTFLGGTQADWGYAIAVDSQGNAYVAGHTESSDFPITDGAFQTTVQSAPFQGHGFVAKLNSTGSALVYSTYLGGNGQDQVSGIAADSSGDAFIAGGTASTDFPTTSGAPQRTFGGGQSGTCYLGAVYGCGDAFAAELNPQGTGLVYSTYLGGNGGDIATGIVIDSAGAAYLSGNTASPDFPITQGAYQNASLCLGTLGSTAFVTKLNPLGAGLAYSTLLRGGSPSDGPCGVSASGIAVDSGGSAYITGSTGSTTFPTVNAFQTKQTDPNTSAAWSWAFVTKFHPAGCGLLYSTLLGGRGFPGSWATGIAVDSNGSAYVTGSTADLDFPTLNPFQATYTQANRVASPAYDTFVTKLAPSGTSIVYSSYLGGSSSSLPAPYGPAGDFGNAIAVDSAGNAYVAGKTNSPDFPVVNAVDGAYTPGTSPYYYDVDDAFVSKIGPQVVPSITINPSSLTFAPQATGTTSPPQTVTVSNTTSSPVTITSVASYFGTYTYLSVTANTCITTLPPGASCQFGLTWTPTTSYPYRDSIVIHDNAFAGPHAVQVNGAAFTPPSVEIFPAVANGNAEDFGARLVGSTSSITEFVQNKGTQDLIVSGITITGSFQQTNQCVGTVPGGSQCTIDITFTPTAAGNSTGTLTVTDNASDSPQSVTLRGTGVDYTIGAAAGTPTSATITAGQTATFTASFSTQAGITGLLTATCSGAPAKSNCSLDSTTVILTGSNSVTDNVRITTTANSNATARRPGNGHPFTSSPRQFIWGIWPILWLLSVALVAAEAVRRRRGRPSWAIAATVVLALTLWASCGGGSVGGGGGSIGAGGGGGGGSSGTPAGTYSITVTGTSGTVTHSTTFTLKVN